jgi:hypothetical protein
MTRTAHRTVLDAALSSLAIKVASTDPTLVPVPLEALAAPRRAAAPLPPAPSRVGLKVIVQTGSRSLDRRRRRGRASRR